MNLLKFGQPSGGVIQIAYTVADIEQATKSYAQDLNIAPWVLRGPFTATNAVYRGKPVPLKLSIAHTFSGHTMIELIQQHDGQPSVYKDHINKHGHGFHHWGIASTRYDEELREYEQKGFELVFTDMTAVNTRVAYFDTHRGWPGFIELIEINAASEARYTKMYTDVLTWDGKEAVRRI